jgi:ribosomal-protein-alanine N-acetyltransferase
MMDESSILPRLESEEVILEALTEADASQVFNFASHDQVAKTVTWEAHKNVEVSREYIRRVRSLMSRKNGEVFLSWGVRDKESNQIVGLVSISERAEIRAQIGYVFHYDHWNRTVPLAALRLATHYAFEAFPRFERIQARCFPTSVSSRDLLQRLGMKFEGVNHAMMRVRGQLVDLSSFALTRTSWNAHRMSSMSKMILAEELAEHI